MKRKPKRYVQLKGGKSIISATPFCRSKPKKKSIARPRVFTVLGRTS